MVRLLLALSLLLLGCAKRSPEASYAMDYAVESTSSSTRSAPAAKASAPQGYGRGGPPAPPPAPPRSAPAAPVAQAAPAQTTPAPDPAQAPEEAAAARMVHYQGFAQLRVGKEQEAVDAVIALATNVGGGLEQQYGNTVVLRVPVAKFREVFDAVLAVGDVVSKSISAEDVTEAFMSVELRLTTAAARRDRLVALLAQSKDENEKLALVREIQEVTEEIDRLEQQVRTLRSLADFSRITVQIEQRPALTWQGGAPESAAFAWIRALTPFEQGLAGKKLAMETPIGFVALDVKKRFVAESADGARIWSTRLKNDPVGDTAFWTDALERRLSTEFAEAKVVSVGEWRGLRVLDRSDEPYVWVVLVRASGADLDVVQVFYPSLATEAEYAHHVEAVLGGGGAA